MIVHLKLINGQEIVAQYIDEDKEIYILRFPLLLEYNNLSGFLAMNFSKYLPFSDTQIVTLQQNHVLAIATASDAFSKYYVNSVLYQEYFVQPYNIQGLESASQQMEFMTSVENIQFLEKLKELKDQIPSFPTTLQ